MGVMRNAQIEAFKAAVERGDAAYEPATGRRAELIEAATRQARGLIETLALEASGVRDGDGCWSGGDPIDYYHRSLVETLDELRRIDYQKSSEACGDLLAGLVSFESSDDDPRPAA